ncbi:hypothetical protein DID80_02200 [Candidatus Marinamargulisbacteria bacterium SCGC AAA071-K20]|nr:hypothetical protein DID80_02200 [Candidatus Marinamargulisbacteria bacterium SCGC AAA071-K20]
MSKDIFHNPKVKIIDTLTQLTEGKYKSLKDKYYDSSVSEILKVIMPIGSFLGECDIFEENTDFFTLITSPNWRNLIKNVPENSLDKVVVLCIPYVSNCYFEVLMQIKKELKRNGSLLTIKRSCFKEYFDKSKTFKHQGLTRLFWLGSYKLQRLNTSKLESFIPIFKEMPGQTKDYVYIAQIPGAFSPKLVEKNKKRIDFVESNLSDKKSKDCYRILFQKNIEEFWSWFLKESLTSIQYFEYLSIEADSVVINIGIAKGWELPFFLNKIGKEGMLINVDPEGHDSLSEYSEIYLKNSKTQVLELKKYVSDIHGNSNTLSKTGFESITIEQIQELYMLDKIDIIKMDIEGDEEIFVPTLIDVVKKFRPQLAICIYHKIEHFWNLPHQIIKYCENYNFYVNTYSSNSHETVFYAIPKEKETLEKNNTNFVPCSINIH